MLIGCRHGTGPLETKSFLGRRWTGITTARLRDDQIPQGERILVKGPFAMSKQRNPTTSKSFFGNLFSLLKQTFQEWLQDKAPQLGAALAYYTVFSLAPLILLLLAVIGVVFRDDTAGAWSKLTEQVGYFLDKSAIQVIQDIARTASTPGKSTLATIIGIALALFGASGVFGQLQDALNTIWGVKAKPGLGIWGFLRARFLSFAMVAGICFLLLVSLAIEALLKGFSHYLQSVLPGGIAIAVTVYLVFVFAVVVLLFAMIFKFKDEINRHRDRNSARQNRLQVVTKSL